MRTLLAVSPHLDDAVFSAGALLARHARKGWRVVIATCFTTTVPDPQGFALACQLDKGFGPEVDYMALRRAEDEAACAVLGCEPLHLPFPEAPHRGYNSPAALFGAALPDDDVAAPLAHALATLCTSMAPDLLAGPAAIGRHIDHVIVRHVVEHLHAPNTLLWADMPYATRAAFDRSDFQAVRCNSLLAAKLKATASYKTQLDFQFGTQGGG